MASASYKFLKKFDPATNDGKRLPPQLQMILDHIEKHGKGPVTQEELVKELSEGNKLNTRQPIERVINFYHQRMKDLGLVEVTKTQSAARTAPATTVVVGDPATQGQRPSAPPTGAAQQVGAKAPV